MTDLELRKKAEEMWNKKGYFDCTDSDPQSYGNGYIEGYIDGAKENIPVWHDLRKNPDDLPPPTGFFKDYLVAFIGAPSSCVAGEVVTEQKTWDYDAMKWREIEGGEDIPYFDKKGVVIAWCEIPKFEESK